MFLYSIRYFCVDNKEERKEKRKKQLRKLPFILGSVTTIYDIEFSFISISIYLYPCLKIKHIY